MSSNFKITDGKVNRRKQETANLIYNRDDKYLR